MDVLLGSIDVRDLLSTQDLDESSPLSAPDLHLLIDRLQIRSLHIKDKVRDYVLAHHADFAAIFSRCSLAASRVDDLSRALSDALGVLSDRPLDLEIRDLVDEIRAKRRDLDERREALGLVRVMARLMEMVKKARDDLETGSFLDAAETLRDLKARMLVGEENKEEEPLVFELLRNEWTECFDELQRVLAGKVEDAIQFESQTGGVRVMCWWTVGETNKIELKRVLQAMEVVGILDYGLSKVADLMIKHVMLPAVSNGSILVFMEEPNQEHVRKPKAILKLALSAACQESLDDATMYARVTQIIKFIYEFICFENAAWMRCIGKLTWSRLADIIISSFLSKAVPDDASKMADFHSTIRCTTEFEAFLKEVNFISMHDSKEEKLSHFAQNVEVHFASRRRNEILAKARSILLEFSHDHSLESTSSGSLPASGVVEGCSIHVADLLFQPERCSISKAASQLMDLVHETLRDVCLSSARVAKEFYHAARDALFLHRAIVPIMLDKQLENISQVAIVIHNDCVYLAQEILALAFEFRADFPSGLKQQAIFVDMAPHFYQMAEDILQKQVQLVYSSLSEAIDGANGFQNTHQSQQYESAKFCIDQVIFILEKIHIIWEPLMPTATYKRTMCVLLDLVFSEITKDMLLLDDMAAEETLQLQRLIHMTLDNLSSVFKTLIADEADKERFLNNLIWAQLEEMIPGLRKLRKLGDLFDMPLKSITTSWETGDLINCGFTPSEVDNFVKAIFADSPLRKECLWRIRPTPSQNS